MNKTRRPWHCHHLPAYLPIMHDVMQLVGNTVWFAEECLE